MHEIEWAGERLLLSPERAIVWPGAQTLLIADPHWGKAATLRAAGLPMPGGSTTDDLARLSRLLHETSAGRLIVLGDLFHARSGRAPRTLTAVNEWRATHADLEVLVVRGNHDHGAGDPPAEWRFDCVDEPWPCGPFALRHYPIPTEGAYTLAGHLHPAATMQGPGRQRLRLPCFFFDEQLGILPAYGSLTGLADVRPRMGDRVFVIAGEDVISVA